MTEKEIATAAAITQPVYPHLLRHTVAQRLLEGDEPREQVQKLLGHETRETPDLRVELASHDPGRL